LLHDRSVARNLSAASNAALAARAEVEQVNARLAEDNQRILEVLEATMGINHGHDVEAWWEAWQDANDVYAYGTPVFEDLYYDVDYEYYAVPQTSCFIAGTPVWTKSGLTSIEQIAVGDQVLSQNPITGELDFQRVLRTTVRPPTPIVHLRVDDESIYTTRGHRFWVNGFGWRMANSLEPAMDLHSIDGAVTLAAVDRADEFEVYNLEVDEFHTYFVGNHKLLVHDNQCPQPIRGPLPGMAQATRAPVSDSISP
jgi:hypothetical protein